MRDCFHNFARLFTLSLSLGDFSQFGSEVRGKPKENRAHQPKPINFVHKRRCDPSHSFCKWISRPAGPFQLLCNVYEFVFDYRLGYWWQSVRIHVTKQQQECHVLVQSRSRPTVARISSVDNFHPKTLSFPLGPWVKSNEHRPPPRMTTPSKDVEKSVSFYEVCSHTVCLPTKSYWSNKSYRDQPACRNREHGIV